MPDPAELDRIIAERKAIRDAEKAVQLLLEADDYDRFRQDIHRGTVSYIRTHGHDPAHARMVAAMRTNLAHDIRLAHLAQQAQYLADQHDCLHHLHDVRFDGPAALDAFHRDHGCNYEQENPR